MENQEHYDNYIKNLSSYYMKKKKINPKHRYWNKVLLDKAIDEYIKIELQQQSSIPCSKTQDILFMNYEVICEDNQQYLILKRKDSNDPIIKMITIEECFHLLIKAHECTNHGNLYATAAAIPPTFIVPKICVKMFIEYCPECQHKQLHKRFYTRGIHTDTVQIRILAVKGTTARFNFILIYMFIYLEDCSYVLLRPLMQMNSNEIGMEIFKIFTDFGIPRTLKIATLDIDLYLAVSLQLQAELKPRFELTLIQVDPAENKFYQLVEKKLLGWMQKTGCYNWDIGCYIVQRELNQHDTKPSWTVVEDEPDELSCNLCVDDELNESYASSVMKTSSFIPSNIKLLDNISENTDQPSTSKLPDIPDDKLDLKVEILSDDSDLECVPETKKEMAIDVNEQESLKPICHVCQSTILVNPFVCNSCKKPLHLFCGNRSTMTHEEGRVIIVTCLSCQS